MTGSAQPVDFETELHAFCADCYADPLSFVRGAYPWPIHGEPGPDVWQAGVLSDIGLQVQDRGGSTQHCDLDSGSESRRRRYASLFMLRHEVCL